MSKLKIVNSINLVTNKFYDQSKKKMAKNIHGKRKLP